MINLKYKNKSLKSNKKKASISFDNFWLGNKLINIGRSPKSDILIAESYVSKKHVVIIKNDDSYQLIDNSRHGVEVNGTKVSKKHDLCKGDSFQIGSSKFIFSTIQDLAFFKITKVSPHQPKVNNKKIFKSISGEEILKLTEQTQ